MNPKSQAESGTSSTASSSMSLNSVSGGAVDGIIASPSVAVGGAGEMVLRSGKVGGGGNFLGEIEENLVGVPARDDAR
jgi:hypothetical protein